MIRLKLQRLNVCVLCVEVRGGGGTMLLYFQLNWKCSHKNSPELVAICSPQGLHREVSPPELQQQMHERSHQGSLNQGAAAQPRQTTSHHTLCL